VLSINSNTATLQQKIQSLSESMPHAIAKGVVEATDQMVDEIDKFMFVPLRFLVNVEQKEDEVIANVQASLSPRIRFGDTKGTGRSRDRLLRRLSRKTWADHVSEQAAASGNDITKVIGDYVRKELQT
jgi:hypothetical protein